VLFDEAELHHGSTAFDGEDPFMASDGLGTMVGGKLYGDTTSRTVIVHEDETAEAVEDKRSLDSRSIKRVTRIKDQNKNKTVAQWSTRVECIKVRCYSNVVC
jgi:hypothetical protein